MNQTTLNVQVYRKSLNTIQYTATSEHRNLPHGKLSDSIQWYHVQLNYVNDFSSVRESSVAMGSNNTDLDRFGSVTRSVEPK
jgi:hypothetical protein